MIIYDVNKYSNNKSLDGKELQKGQVLAPLWIQEGYHLSEAEKSRLTTWKLGSFKFLIGYIAIPVESFPEYIEFFYKEINNFISEHRKGRCIVGHKSSDGTPICCPKKNRCTGCAEKGHHSRYNPRLTVLSLDNLKEKGIDINDINAVNPLEHLIRKEEEVLGDPYTRLIGYFHISNPRYAKIIELKMQHISDKEIIIRLGLKPSRGYQEINNAYLAAKRFFDNNEL